MNAKPRKIAITSLVVLSLIWVGCDDPVVTPVKDATSDIVVKTALPYIGEHDVELVRKANGAMVADTVYYTIPKFSYTNQNGKEVSHRDYLGKVVVADFFFSTCTSICPAMSSQMARLQSLVKKNGMDKDVMFLSHTVKPTEDTPEILKSYAGSIGAELTNWNFVTGNPEDIFEQAKEGYMLTAFPSDTAEGGVFHTDQFTLLDREMHIRGYYDGTSTKSVDQLFEDLKLLVKEKINE